MGHPRDVAREYRGSTTLISRDFEPIIEMMIKIISIALPLLLLFVNLIEFLVSHNSFTTMELLLHLMYQLPVIISTLLSMIGMIFIVFVLIERYIQPRFTVDHDTFDPRDLPDAPTKVFRTNLVGNIIGILVNVAILYILNYQQGLIAIYFEGNQIPLLNDHFSRVLPLFNISIFISIIIHTTQAFLRRKNYFTKTMALMNGIFVSIILIYMATQNIFNMTLIEGYNLDIVTDVVKYALIFTGVVVLIASILDYLKMFVDFDKLSQKNG
ncbi:MAG: hypothetical protein UMR38_06210 [Candidatus Izemoplasma sp.]|nr:hypothetical protein [Candidatus Izemoplasma sp.]